MANGKDQEFLSIFIEEATDLVASLSSTLKQWEENLSDSSQIENLKRDLHTLKGSARMVGQMNIGTLTHEIESLCDVLEKEDIPVTRDIFASIRSGIDRITLMIEMLKNHEEPKDASDLIKKFQDLLPETAKAAVKAKEKAKVEAEEIKREKDLEREIWKGTLEGKRKTPATERIAEEQKQSREQDVVRIRSQLLEQLNSLSSENSMLHVGLEQHISKLGIYLLEMKQESKRLEIQLNTLNTEIQSYIISGQDSVPVKDQEAVRARNYERFTNLEQIGQVIRETTFDIVSILKGLTDTQSSMETLVLNQGRVSTELQHRLSDTRLAPFSSIVPRLGLIARQISELLNKQVDFKVLKTEGEMDRNVLERLIPSLEHILRNAIDHGIESPARRKELNKPEIGKVTISFSREGSIVIIEVADDGAGMDANKVRKKAIEKGLMPKDADLSDEEVLRFVMTPGFSTKEDITQISGRGVGLDVVNTAIKELGGSLSIVSEPNIGTKIIARFPFTTSLNRILLFSLQDQNYGIMLTSVDSVVTIPYEELSKLLSEPNAVFEHNEKTYHVHYLGAFLEAEKEIIHIPKRKNYPMLLVSSQEFPMAIVVDTVLYSRELIVQTLGAQFKLTNEFSGATILGDGTAIFILDPYNLSIKAKAMSEREKLTYDFEVEKALVPSTKPVIMIVDDSISVRAVTKRLLERNQYRVMAAKDGVDALQQLEKEIPDVILLDLDMPRMDGFEFAENMREHETYKTIPIIVITSRASPAFKKHADDLMLNGFIKKPYQEPELLAAIERLLEE